MRAKLDAELEPFWRDDLTCRGSCTWGASADALDDLQHNILSLITLIMYIKHNITDAT